MSETTELSVIEIKPEQAPALYITNGLDSYLEHIKASVSEVPDLSTKKGRDRVASLSASVSRSKAAIEKPGREYLKRLKEAVKPAEEEIKRFVDACNALRDETRLPLTEWEAEQERIRLEEEAKKSAEALAKEVELLHEIALGENYRRDRETADAAAEAERQRIAHEEELRRQAVEQANREAEERLQQERDAAAKREADLKTQAEQAERDRIALAQKAEQDRIDAAAKAEADRLEAAQKAEREKQEAIAAEQLKAKQEAERIQREAKQKEDARLAEEKRVADEAAARAADVAHRKTIGTAIVNALTSHAGLTREQAIATLTALKDGNIPHTSIQY